MELTNYILSALAVFLGPFTGAVLMFIAPEEFRPGKKYFILLKWLMFLLALALVVVFASNKFWLVVLGLLLIILFFSRKIDIVSSIILGAVLYLSSAVIEMFIIAGTLIFIYGLPAGTLLAGTNKNRVQVLKNVFVRYVWFLAVSVILFIAKNLNFY